MSSPCSLSTTPPCLAQPATDTRRCNQNSRARLGFASPLLGPISAAAALAGADAIPQMRRLLCVDHPKDLQFDLRRQNVEQSTATTEKDRNLMDL